MINYKCPFTTSYSVQTGVKHSLGASVFTGYLGREGTRAQEGTCTAALSRGGGQPAAGGRQGCLQCGTPTSIWQWGAGGLWPPRPHPRTLATRPP